MKTITNKDAVEIIKLLFSNTRDYIDSCNEFLDEDMLDFVKMYSEDIIYNVNNVKKFIKTLNVKKLHRDILEQDTLVREYYYDVLVYIEKNNLIDEAYHACSKTLVD